jgi:hypothetical protein
MIFTIRGMDQRQAGLASPLIVTTVVLGVLVVGLGVFGGWAFSQYLSYKDDVDPKIAAAVKDAKAEQQTSDKAIFDEKEKLPTRTLTGPDDLGKVTLAYPKTWSVYVDKGGSNGQYEAYLHPGEVPGVNSRNFYALRVTIQDKTYESVLNDFQGQVKSGKLKASPVKIGGADGMRLDGLFSNDANGSMVIFKVRDKTLEVYTQLTTYQADFNKIILPSLKFNK